MKNAVVTGASTGIGRATALRLAKDGFHILLVSRSVCGLKETANLIATNGGSSTIFQTDLSKFDQLNSLISKITASCDSLEAVINIAGIWHGENEVYAGKDFSTFDQELIVGTYTVGLIAPTLLVHGLLSLMKANAKVVNISGTFENGAKGWLPYFVSKRALEDYTVGLAQELADKHIQVNAISPSDTATAAYTKYFPEFIPDAISPDTIADKIAELCEVDNITTGRVIVMRKDEVPFEGFHD